MLDSSRTYSQILEQIESLFKVSGTFQLPPNHDDLDRSLLFHPLPQLDGGVQLQGQNSKLAPPYTLLPKSSRNYPIHSSPLRREACVVIDI